MTKQQATAPTKSVTIKAPNIQKARFKIVGTAPLVLNKFPLRVLEQMAADQAAGPTAKSKKKRDPKDFEACFNEARHISEEGWDGLPASAFRRALVSACRLVDFQMTKAKLSLFIEADGYERDRFGATPLVKITKGKPVRTDFAVRNETGVADIRPRPMWDIGWEAVVTIRWDADQFTLEDVTNLLARVGLQVGVGAGRHDSTDSTGMGWGTFAVASAA